MKNLNLTLTFFLIFSIACDNYRQSNKQENELKFKNITRNGIIEMKLLNSVPIEIEIPQEFGTLNIDEEIKEMRYIRLETNEHSIIGRIDKLIIHNESIFILDKSFSQSIFIFTMEGKYIRTINLKGHGPNEYIGIIDFCFNGDNIVIYDGFGKKLLFLNEQGDFLYKKETGFHFRNIQTLPNGDYILVTRSAQNHFFNEISNYSLLIGRPDTIVKFKGFKNNSFLSEFKETITNPIVQYNSQFLFTPLLSNYIYQINFDGSFFPKYHLNFLNELPENYYNETNVKNFHNYVKKYSYFMGVFFENDNHLFLRFNPPQSSYGYVIFNKKSHKIICYDSTKSTNGLYLGFSSPKCTYLNYFVGSIETVDIIKRKEKFLRTHSNSPNILSMIELLKENDNPILILYTFN
jgi:hypothetical protein